jgi:hypothetical protein
LSGSRSDLNEGPRATQPTTGAATLLTSHLVGAGEQRLYREAERLGEIDDQHEFGRLLDCRGAGSQSSILHKAFFGRQPLAAAGRLYPPLRIVQTSRARSQTSAHG